MSHLHVWSVRVNEKFTMLRAPEPSSTQTTPGSDYTPLKLKSERILTNQDSMPSAYSD